MNADLFISLHANYGSNKNASGIETFCLSPALITSRPLGGIEYQSILPSCISHEIAAESNQLAQAVHRQSLLYAAKYNSAVVDRQVKYQVTQVLLCTMPSALIELGFMSHAHEARLLADPEYQGALAQGISQGIALYLTRKNVRQREGWQKND